MNKHKNLIILWKHILENVQLKETHIFLVGRNIVHSFSILFGDELYGSEGIQQVYGLLTDFFENLSNKDALTHLLYDDQCHLKKFSENPERANLNEVTQKVAKLEKFVDKFHFRNHVDKWCQDNCNPDDCPALKGVNSQVCEQLFKKINSHKNCLSMNEARFSIFFLYQYEMHNLDVERMTVLADPRQEFRWLKLKTEEPNLNDIEDKADEVVEVNVVQELATNFSNLKLEFPFPCDECDAKYKKEGFLKSHKLKKHNSEVGGKVCEECDQVFPTAAGLEKHRKKHRICTICKVEFTTQKELEIHRKIHFSCELCNYDYKTAYNFNRHIEGFHKGYFSCQLCNHDYKTPSNLKKHMEDAHKD